MLINRILLHVFSIKLFDKMVYPNDKKWIAMIDYPPFLVYMRNLCSKWCIFCFEKDEILVIITNMWCILIYNHQNGSYLYRFLDTGAKERV